jgi:hypothetical protein
MAVKPKIINCFILSQITCISKLILDTFLLLKCFKILFIFNANMVTLKEYLNRQNPDINNNNILSELNTVYISYSHISEFKD